MGSGAIIATFPELQAAAIGQEQRAIFLRPARRIERRLVHLAEELAVRVVVGHRGAMVRSAAHAVSPIPTTSHALIVSYA